MYKILIALIFSFLLNFSTIAQFGNQNIIASSLTYISEPLSFDIDGDGAEDILCYHQSGTFPSSNDSIVWFKNLGNGNFSSKIKIGDSAKPIGAINGYDIDNDGDIDVIYTADRDDKIYWLENLGVGIFSTDRLIADSLDEPNGISFGDFDSDGIGDLAVSSYKENKVVWYKNYGAGVFSSEKLLADSINIPNKRAIANIDIDGDGDIDVIASSHNQNTIFWYENNGVGIFIQKHIITDSVNGVVQIKFEDIDLDGKKDIIYSTSSGSNIYWKKNLGSGMFGNQITISLSNSLHIPHELNLSDIDGDNDYDILIHLNAAGVVWLENQGGNFVNQPHVIINNPFNSTPILGARTYCTFIDIDNDGDNDVVLADRWNNKLFWMENYFVSPNKIEGEIYYDENQNGIKDSLDYGLNFNKAYLSPIGLSSFSSNNGEYIFGVDTGDYVVNHTVTTNWNLTSDSSSFQVKIDSTNPSVDSLNFGFYPDTFFTNINTTLISSFPRCNTIGNFWLDLRNTATTTPSGIIHLKLDDSLTYINSDLTPDSIIGKNVYWHYDSLLYYSNKQIRVTLRFPDFNSIGDTLTSSLVVHHFDSSNLILSSFKDSVIQIIRCAYDPNDKQVTPKGIGAKGFISQNESLEYTVRFQNTGNDTAINIKIRDQLDGNLEWDSIYPIASSHAMTMRIENNGWLIIEFNDINLPDSNVDYLKSQGFVRYKAIPKNNLSPLTKIKNKASIFFDFNPPIITNEVLNTIKCDTISINIIRDQSGSISTSISGIFKYQWYLNDTILIGDTNSFILQNKNGIYSLLITDTNGCSSFSNKVSYFSSIKENSIKNVSIHPNPNKGVFILELGEIIELKTLFITDINGRLIKEISPRTTSFYEINFEGASGIYFLNVVSENERMTLKLIKE